MEGGSGVTVTEVVEAVLNTERLTRDRKTEKSWKKYYRSSTKKYESKSKLKQPE